MGPWKFRFWIVVVHMVISGASLFENTSVILAINLWTGVDNEGCLSQNAPCRTLDFAYRKSIVTYLKMKELVLQVEGLYLLNETFNIDVPSPVLMDLRVIGKTESLVVARSQNASIVLGSQYDYTLYVSYNISFQNMAFHEFGSINPAVIIGWHVAGLQVISCKFINNTCAAINILDSHIYIQSSVFNYNSVNKIHWNQGLRKSRREIKEESFPFGGVSAGGCVGVVFLTGQAFNVLIQGNQFIQNEAEVVDVRAIYQTNHSFLLFARTGGAVLLVLSSTSSRNKVIIKNNYFLENRASIGGAVMISTHGETGYNMFVIDNCEFRANLASNTGGGFAFASWNRSSNNKLSLLNSIFAQNQGRVGGGVKILFQSRDIYSVLDPAIQIVDVVNVSFVQNTASVASGMHLIYNLALSLKPAMSVSLANTSFVQNNFGLSSLSNEPSAYSGVLLTNRVDVKFQGENYFSGNLYESALYASNAELHINGKLSFIGNSVQTSGGGITIADVGNVIMHPGSELLFLNNFAKLSGGAMFIKTVGYPETVYSYNPSCFLQYSVPDTPPSEWNVKLNFTRNGAGTKGAAIFANTLTPCIWDEEEPYWSFEKALRWNRNFIYAGNYLTDDNQNESSSKLWFGHGSDRDIATDTTHFELLFPNKTLTASPGQPVLFGLAGYDELNHPVHSVPVASQEARYENGSEAEQPIRLRQTYFVVSPLAKESHALNFEVDEETYGNLRGDDGIKQHIQFIDSYSSFISDTEMTVKVVPCPPGHTYQNKVCVCSRSSDVVVRCSDQLVFIKEGYWGYVHGNGQLGYIDCPTNYCNCSRNESMTGCAFNSQNPDLQCSSGREGVLCGRCKPGYGLNLLTQGCAPCERFSWSVLLLVLITALVVVGAVLVILLNPNFSSHMRGIIFYIQVLPYLCRPVGPVNQVMLHASAWLNLGGTNGMPVFGCLSHGFSSFHAIALGYAYPMLILLVLVVMFLLNRMYLVTFRRDYPFQSFWILIVAMYKFLVETSFLLLYCVPFQGKSVFYFDGNVQCYKDFHLALTIVAWVVIALLVVLPPIFVGLVVCGVVHVTPAISDCLRQGLRSRCHWWWSYDFVRRILVIVIFVFCQNWETRQILLVVSCIFISAMHMQFQPYVNKRANWGEAYLLVSLTVIVVFNASETGNLPVGYILATLLLLSCLYCFLITLYLFVGFIRRVNRARLYSTIEPMRYSSQVSLAKSPLISRPCSAKVLRGTPTNPITRSDLDGLAT